MARTHQYFFATRSDLEAGIKSLEASKQLKYTLASDFLSPELEIFTSLLDLPDLGIATTGRQISEKDYLVVERDSEIILDEFHRRDGAVVFGVNQLLNPTSITFQPGGMFEERCLISGRIATCSRDPRSIELFRFFSKGVLMGFVKYREGFYRLGPQALELFQKGMLLTSDIRQPALNRLELPL
jgi:hypothetical protein